MDQGEINALIKEIDYKGNGKINYSEFLSATLDMKLFLTDAKLISVFNFFDTDHSGFITEQNIKFAFQKLGQELPTDVIKQLLKRHDIKKDGIISFDEFKVIFQEHMEDERCESEPDLMTLAVTKKPGSVLTVREVKLEKP